MYSVCWSLSTSAAKYIFSSLGKEMQAPAMGYCYRFSTNVTVWLSSISFSPSVLTILHLFSIPFFITLVQSERGDSLRRPTVQLWKENNCLLLLSFKHLMETFYPLTFFLQQDTLNKIMRSNVHKKKKRKKPIKHSAGGNRPLNDEIPFLNLCVLKPMIKVCRSECVHCVQDRCIFQYTNEVQFDSYFILFSWETLNPNLI